MGSIELLERVCGPPRSPDLNPCAFYLWRKLKSVVYANNTRDLEALKQNNREAIHSIQQREFAISLPKSV
jgi:hypothetical protein